MWIGQYLEIKFPFVFHRERSGALRIKDHGAKIDVSARINSVLAENTPHLEIKAKA